MTYVNTNRNHFTQPGDAGDHPDNTMISDADLVGRGTQQGIEVAQLEAGNANFDIGQYADSIVPYLQGLGLSDNQVETYLSAMVSEFNYLTPTAKLDPQNANIGSGIINQVLPNASEPGQSENPDTTSPQTLSDQGTVLGKQLAAVQNSNWSNFDIGAYTQNLAQQMSQAGYNQNQVQAFTNSVLLGYTSALGGYLSQ